MRSFDSFQQQYLELGVLGLGLIVATGAVILLKPRWQSKPLRFHCVVLGALVVLVLLTSIEPFVYVEF